MGFEQQRLAEFVPSPLTLGDKERILERVLESRERRRPRVAPMLALGLTVAAAALVWFAFFEPSSAKLTIAPETHASQWYATGDERMVVVLEGGRRIGLESATQVNVPGEQADRVRLERGMVRCEGDSRRLTIEAGDAEVFCDSATLTAQMEIDRDGPHLSVTAVGGQVTLRHKGTLHRVAVGQTWTSRAGLSSLPAPTEASRSNQAAAPTAPVGMRKEPASPPAAPRTSAETLWKEAQDARLAGSAHESARLFARLKNEFPNDSRAGLAAFELGRIQLDRLGNPSGAVESFSFALKHGKGGFFAEDAAAGRVSALDRIGNAAACARAREAFLERYAGSPHVARIRGLCNTQ